MKKDKAVFDFVKLPVAEKPEFGTNVIQKMTGNLRFPTPDVSLEILKQKNDTLQSRSVDALSGGKEATILLHQAIDDWDDTMRTMANYVNRIANGDGAVIVSAGFNLAKQPTPGPRPEFEAEAGDKPGTVILRHQAIDGARSYIWQFCTGDSPAGEAGWSVGSVSTKASTTIEGLTSMTKYWFRVSGVTIEGTTAYCQPISMVVV
jgi:hypothetical protein